MDVLEMRVSEYAGKACAVRVPNSYAVEKSEYIKERKEIIKKIDSEISELTKKLNGMKDKKSYFYQVSMNRLKKCYEIKQNCEASIVLAKEQIKKR